MSARSLAWLGASALTVLSAAVYGQLVSEFDWGSTGRIILPALMGLGSLLMVFLSPDTRSFRDSVLWIWIPAIILRFVLLPTAPSDDINRYLWEGKLVREGMSPYQYRGDALEWTPFRDRYWEAMNHKDKPTAYPPLSELVFSAIGIVRYHPLSYKLAFTLADLLTLGAVLALLRRRGTSTTFAGFYAFNPVTLLSYAGEAHFDAMMIAPLVWALYFYETGKTPWAIALASMASGIKWITLPLLPFFAGRKLSSGALLAIAVLAAPALFFWDSLPQLLSGLLQFGSTRSFNGPVYDLLRFGLELPRTHCSRLVAAGFVLILTWRWFIRERAGLDSHIRWVLGTLVVLSPTVHFWYLAWLLPFVALRPSLPWLTFSITASSYFFVWLNPVWELVKWQKYLFWLPFFLALFYELWTTRGRVIWPVRRLPSDGKVSVVVPTLNAAEVLPDALASMNRQSLPVDDVILVDAGSCDGTLSLAESFERPLRIVHSVPGRGQQILAGLEAAATEWVIVLHADSVLQPYAVADLKAAAQTYPLMLGGAFGQRFQKNPPALLLIELLNDARSLFTRTAFGDQGQFFHRASALEQGLIPGQPLMEDVESSWRLRECGEFVFLGQANQVSGQKWKSVGWLKRFTQVVWLVFRYRLARLRGKEAAESLSFQLYREYYGRRE